MIASGLGAKMRLLFTLRTVATEHGKCWRGSFFPLEVQSLDCKNVSSCRLSSTYTLHGYLYKRLVRLRWSADAHANKHMCVKGSFGFLFLWENMTNGYISTDHPTRVSTDTGTYIKKKYLVLVLSTTEEGFDFLIITLKDGGGPTAALKVNPKMYMLIENHWAQSDVPEGEQAPVHVVMTYCLDLNAMLHLQTRYMKFKNSLLWPAGAQSSRRRHETAV